MFMKRIVYGVAALAGASLYLAISISGWGSFTGYYSNPARLGLTIVMFGLTATALFTNSSGLGSGVREDKSNRWVLLPIIIIGFLMTWLTAFLDRHNEWVMGGETIRWVGFVVCLLGGIVRMVPVFALGRRFSGLVAIQPGHTLKTDGPYRFIRHPSYLGLITSTLGWCLVFRCVVPGILMTAVIAATMVVRMNSEENLLQSQFGDEYKAYKSRTWRLVPYVY
jgi:protein-S-isoprenylcysteine O-methyltransferase Ste14